MSVKNIVMSAAGGDSLGPSDEYFKNVSLLLQGDGTNGAQNNTFLDSSTNNFTITRNGNTTQGTFSPYGSLWSNYFDGTGDYFTPPNSAAFQFGTGDFTLEAWINPDALLDYAAVISQLYTTANTQWNFCIMADGSLNFTSWYASFRSSAGLITKGQWNHVVVTRGSGTASLFINGTRVATEANTKDWSTTLAARIGYSGAAGDNYFKGYISNARVVKGSAVYNPASSTITVPTAQLIAVSGTSLLTCQSNRFIDNSSNNFTLTVNGNTSVQRFSPFNPTAPYDAATIGGSGYFDGTGDYLDTATNATAFSMGTGDFTVEGWAYKTASTDDVGTVCLQSVSSTTLGMRIYWYSGSLSFQCGVTGTGTGGSSVSEPVPALGSWFHFAAVRNSGTIRLYVNGVSTTSAANSSNITSQFASIGRELTGYTNFYWPGYLSSVRIVKGTAVYTSNFTPSTTPLTAVSGTSLLTNFTNAGIPDAAMMNDLETVGNAQVSTSVKKYGTGSLAFDGTGDWLIAPFNTNYNLGTGSFTVEGWFYLNNVSGVKGVVGCFTEGSGPGWTIYIPDDRLEFWGGTGGITITSSSTLSATTWYHFAVVRNGSTITMYINGTSVGSVSNSSFTDSSNPLYVGGRNGSFPFNGYIDDLRITKGYARYTANFNPPTAALPNY